MWRHTIISVMMVICVTGHTPNPRSGDELVTTVLNNCVEMTCVKQNVLLYLNNLLNLQSDARNAKNIDTSIMKRVAKVLQTYRIKFKLPTAVFDQTEVVYDPRSGWDISSPAEESRVIGLKKKLLFPLLLLLKLKMKLLMPVFVAIIGLKAMKALVLSKLAIIIVVGFIAYQLLGKAGMPMPLSMTPAPVEPPASMYGVPNPSTAPPSSYEPGWEPNQGGPYQRIWSVSNSDPQSLAYSAYYPGMSSSSSSTSGPLTL